VIGDLGRGSGRPAGAAPRAAASAREVSFRGQTGPIGNLLDWLSLTQTGLSTPSRLSLERRRDPKLAFETIIPIALPYNGTPATRQLNGPTVQLPRRRFPAPDGDFSVPDLKANLLRLQIEQQAVRFKVPDSDNVMIDLRNKLNFRLVLCREPPRVVVRCGERHLDANSQ